MHQNVDDILEYLAGDDVIPADLVMKWMQLPDLESRGVVYKLTNTEWSRIRPEISANTQCSFMAKYLIDCIRTNPESQDDLHSGFEAAWEFAGWLKHLEHIGESDNIRLAARLLEENFRESDREVRERIETGALEHLLEVPALRPYFESWSRDPLLSPSHARALEWGIAHERQPGT